MVRALVLYQAGRVQGYISVFPSQIFPWIKNRQAGKELTRQFFPHSVNFSPNITFLEKAWQVKYVSFVVWVNWDQSKKEGKDQKWIQSSATPDPEYQWESIILK